MASSYSTERIAHAQHNYDAYLYLRKAENDKFLDWVATTAYYSANHFAKGKLFPHNEVIEGSKETFDNFEDYYNVKHGRRSISLHKALISLSYIELDNKIAGAIKKLHDYSDTARYHDYKLSDYSKKEDLKRDIESKIDMVRAHCTS